MIKKKFCIVGVDPDFNQLIFDNKKNYIGLITNFGHKKYLINNKVLGKETLNDWIKIKKKFNPSVIIAINDGVQRRILSAIYKKNLINYIDKTVQIDRTTFASIKNRKGIFINKLSYISSDVEIDDGVKLHVRCNVHHHVKIEKFVTLSPCSIILGGARIGENSFIGSGSIINPNIKIGKNCMIGSGSVVTKDVADNLTVFGVPARIND